MQRIAGAAIAAGSARSWRRAALPACGKRNAEELIYLRFAGGAKAARRAAIDDARRWPAKPRRSWRARIAWFDDATTPYLPRVRPLQRRQRRRLRPSGAGARMVAVAAGAEERMSADPSIDASDPAHLRLGRGQCRRGQDLYPGQPRGAAAAGRRAAASASSASPSPRRRRRRCRTGCSGSWANGRCCPTTNLRDEIAAIGGRAADDLPKARRLFAQALETPGGLKILTIHAFCQIVLSRFPHRGGRAARLRGAGRRSRRAN